MHELITLQEAADLLDCTTDRVRRIARQGNLTNQYGTAEMHKEVRYKRSEVVALSEVWKKKLNLQQVAGMSQRAYVTSRALETRVERLLEVLGIDIPMLEMDEASVLANYINIEDALDDELLILSPEEVYSWSKIFYAMGEEYLGLIEEYCEDPEPWQKPLQLAQRISLGAPNVHTDRQMDEAYSRFEFARKSMRHAAYFYVRGKHGKDVSGKLFPETLCDANQKILAMMFVAED